MQRAGIQTSSLLSIKVTKPRKVLSTYRFGAVYKSCQADYQIVSNGIHQISETCISV